MSRVLILAGTFSKVILEDIIMKKFQLYVIIDIYIQITPIFRMLKPYIRRDFETEPLKLCLLREILEKTKHRKEDRVVNNVVTRHPIDYMYVRAHHIPSVNQLARQFFWPGIDSKLH